MADVAKFGLIRAAIDSYQTSLRLEPRNADGWTNLGLARQRSGDYVSVITAYQTALQLRHEDSLALYNLALARVAQGDLPKALKASERRCLIDRRKWNELMIMMFGFSGNKSSP